MNIQGYCLLCICFCNIVFSVTRLNCKAGGWCRVTCKSRYPTFQDSCTKVLLYTDLWHCSRYKNTYVQYRSRRILWVLNMHELRLQAFSWLNFTLLLMDYFPWYSVVRVISGRVHSLVFPQSVFITKPLVQKSLLFLVIKYSYKTSIPQAILCKPVLVTVYTALIENP
jgi:hypothetical protein